MSQRDEHYLKSELYELVKSDDSIFEFLQSGSLDGIWYWDLERPEHEWMSPKFWQLFGYSPAERKHLASEWQDMINPADLETALSNFKRHCEDPDHPYDQLVRYSHKDGSTVWVRCRGLAVRDEEGKPLRMLGAHTDVTAVKSTEAKLRAALESNYELEQFAYLASHDLREPLRTVIAYLDLLTKHWGEKLDAEASEYVRVVTDSAERMRSMVTAMLHYAQIGTSHDAFETAPLSETLARALSSLEVLIEESDAAVTVDTLPDVEVDSIQIERVFRNLLSNAIKYRSDEPPRIHVGCEPADESCVFYVQDNGVGIDPAVHERIFQMFQRLHRFEEYDGHGVGLAICKRIVESHGGRIWVDSRPGEGSRFCFALPVIQRSDGAARVSTDPRPNGAGVAPRWRGTER